LPAQPTFADPRPYLRAAGRLRGVHGWPASPVGGPRRTWLVSVAVAFLFVVSTVVSALFPSASMVWPGSQSLSGGVAVSAAVSVHNRGSSDYSEYRVSAGHSHGPPTVVNVQFCHDQTYYVLAGDTPVLVHNCGGDLPDGAVASRPAVGSGPRRAYQVTHAGDCEYLCTGGGQSVWADGIDATTLLDAKFVGNPARSPFIPGSAIPDRIRAMIHAQTESEFSRYAAVIADPGNPFTGLRVITNHQGAVPYFQGLMSRFGINGSVVVR
jgi:hypothetical protein